MLQNDVLICKLPDLHINEYAKFTHLSLIFTTDDSYFYPLNQLICRFKEEKKMS